MKPVLTLLSSLALGACSVVGIRTGTEEPHFTVLAQIGAPPAHIAIRRYDQRLAAETRVAGGQIAARDIGFRRLAGYIFGGNSAKQSIAMTAPVAQQAASGERIAMTAPVAQQATPDGWVIRFFLPATLARPPTPNDSSVHIVTVPPETYAVLRFSGDRDADAIARRTGQLLEALHGAPWHPNGAPVAWFYDPPWTLPPLRRNEVAVPVTAVP